MTVTVTALPIRAWEGASTGTTKIKIKYTKKDDRVKTLRVTVGQTSKDFDVSSLSPGASAEFEATFSNGLQKKTIYIGEGQATSVTFQAGQSGDIQADNENYWFIKAANTGLTMYDDNGQYWSSMDIVLAPGALIHAENPGSNPITIDIYKVDSTTVNDQLKGTITITFDELDAGGNTLYSYQTSVYDIAPAEIQVVAEGHVEIEKVE